MSHSPRPRVWRCAPIPDSVPAAREFASRVTLELDAKCVLDDVRLCVSELVTNAVTHAKTSLIRVTVHRAGDRVRVEVADDDAATPVLHTHVPEDDEHGRGNFIVACVAAAWGTLPLPVGKLVWAEFAVTIGNTTNHS